MFTKFLAAGRFIESTENAIEIASKGKRVRRDQVMVEMMNLTRKCFAEVLKVI